MSKSLPLLERPPLLNHSVKEAIRTYILDNNLQAGDPLPAESELARQLGVSRSSVREAVKALESLGVLETRRGSGIFVLDFSFEPLLNNLHYGLLFNLDELADLLEVRRVLELGMISQVIPLVTPEQTAKLQSILVQMRSRAEQGEAFPVEDRMFHQALFANLDNRMLLKLIDIFWLAFHKAVERKAFSIWDADPITNYRNHAAIWEAVLAGDATAARVALEQHYTGIINRLAKAKRHLEAQQQA
ncbi:MAG TPA: FadR/GntR family transcriptional regulator [Caldilineaceae bacterium]|nr:FadR/GntR family transcriptional regulator [Caldilineaceae bacterium]